MARISARARHGALRVARGALVPVALALLLAWPALAHAAPGSSLRRADRASELEQRLIAPCCWTQTLDVHDSELSTALRIEIQTRLAGGETAQQIEDALALRYGGRIRAVPRGSDVRGLAPLVVSLVMGLSLLALVWLVRRRHVRPLDPVALFSPSAEDGAYERLLDRELARGGQDQRP